MTNDLPTERAHEIAFGPGIGFIISTPIYWRFDLGARLLHQVTFKEIEDYLKQCVYQQKMEMRAKA